MSTTVLKDNTGITLTSDTYSNVTVELVGTNSAISPYSTSSNLYTNSSISPVTELNGTVMLNGENLEDRLARIEELLHITSRNIELENKYPKLKKIWEEYINKVDQYKLWETLKNSK